MTSGRPQPPASSADTRSLRRFHIIALTTAVSAFALIVLGGIVRITGSGMGCGDDWPLCNGQLIPPMDLATLIEWGHRLVAAGVSLLVATLVALAWKPGRPRSWADLRRWSLIAVTLLVIQVMLGAITVWLELPPTSVILHLGTAMLLLASLLLLTLRSGSPARARAESPDRFARFTWIAAAYGFVVVLFGALVANLDAAPACQGFPLCNGSAWPQMNSLIAVHWGHRLLAYGLLALALFLPRLARRHRPADPAVRRLAWVAAGVVVAQTIVAAAMVLGGLPGSLRALHVALGSGAFVALVLLAWYARWLPTGVRVVEPGEESTPIGINAAQAMLRDYVALTKPRIISLLLVTTIIPMYVAGRPSIALVGWVLMGGYLMAGGANAFNMYLDRDLDARMARTRRRPIPGGRLRPTRVLAFAFTLTALAFTILWTQANLMAALLALAGLLFYVFVYTRWLKRSTPQNIVIGGAAGAFPPLVGWAAVTGSVSITALCLFLIIFYWTPPHFWALALVKKGDYRDAGVPMAPVVWGERVTMRQMMIYTLILLPLTVAPVFFGTLGVLYGLAAIALGARLLWMLVQLMRATEFDSRAWALYRYSLLYLALLFGAMVVDRAISLPATGHAEATPAALELGIAD